VETPDGISRPWQEWADYIEQKGGEMYTCDELINLVHLENGGKYYFKGVDNMTPCWYDKEKTRRDWVGLGEQNIDEGLFCKSYYDVKGTPLWENYE